MTLSSTFRVQFRNYTKNQDFNYYNNKFDYFNDEGLETLTS